MDAAPVRSDPAACRAVYLRAELPHVSQADFDAVGEVLLARPVGLLSCRSLPPTRCARCSPNPWDSCWKPARVSMQPLERACSFKTTMRRGYDRVTDAGVTAGAPWRNRFTGADVSITADRLVIELGVRERCWLEQR